VAELYSHFRNHSEDLPVSFRNADGSQGSEQVVCDYVAGMTDQYALQEFQRLFVPRMWSL
jgi:dGTPase